MKFILLLSIFVIDLRGIWGQFSGTSCDNFDGTGGICRDIMKCDWATTELRAGRMRIQNFKRCGFEGTKTIICCKESTVQTPKPTTKPITTNQPGAVVFFPDDDSPPVPTARPLTTTTIAAPNLLLKRKSEQACDKIKAITVKPVLNFHIINGEPVELGEFPHQAALGYRIELDSTKFNYDCGGSLISRNFVLTASHCAARRNLQPVSVRLGKASLDPNNEDDPETPVDIAVKRIVLHSNYSTRRKYDDIALVELEKPVPEYTKYVKPACLDTTQFGSRSVQTPMTITGWGIIETDTRTRSNWLMKATLNEVSIDECGKNFATPVYATQLPDNLRKTQICATGTSANGIVDACQGDSGGPLQIKHELNANAKEFYYTIVGVTSFGAGCGSVIPGVYTRVSEYLDWVEGIVWPNSVEI